MDIDTQRRTDQGHAQSQYDLGIAYNFGKGVSPRQQGGREVVSLIR
jgi:TPR repeat protein